MSSGFLGIYCKINNKGDKSMWNWISYIGGVLMGLSVLLIAFDIGMLIPTLVFIFGCLVVIFRNDIHKELSLLKIYVYKLISKIFNKLIVMFYIRCYYNVKLVS